MEQVLEDLAVVWKANPELTLLKITYLAVQTQTDWERQQPAYKEWLADESDQMPRPFADVDKASAGLRRLAEQVNA